MELSNDTTSCCVEGIALYSLTFKSGGPFVREFLLTVCSLLFPWQGGSSWSMEDVECCWMLNAFQHPSSLKVYKLLLHLWGKRSCCHSVSDWDVEMCQNVCLPMELQRLLTMYQLSLALHAILRRISLTCCWEGPSCPSPSPHSPLFIGCESCVTSGWARLFCQSKWKLACLREVNLMLAAANCASSCCCRVVVW